MQVCDIHVYSVLQYVPWYWCTGVPRTFGTRVRTCVPLVPDGTGMGSRKGHTTGTSRYVRTMHGTIMSWSYTCTYYCNMAYHGTHVRTRYHGRVCAYHVTCTRCTQVRTRVPWYVHVNVRVRTYHGTYARTTRVHMLCHINGTRVPWYTCTKYVRFSFLG